MKILYAGTGYKPAYRLGGPIVSISAAAEALVRKGHEITVVATTSNNDVELDVPVGAPVDVEGVQVWYFNRTEPLQKILPFVSYFARSIGFMYTPAMRQALDRLVPAVDVVHTQGPFLYPTYATAHAAFRHHRPLVYSQRGAFSVESLQFRSLKKTTYLNAIEKPIMRRAGTLIALTEAERESYGRIGVDRPIAVVPNGTVIPPECPEAASTVHARFGIGPEKPLVLFLGRLHPSKGADKLVEAFERVMIDVPDAVLMIAGPDEWGLGREWRQRAGDNANSRILFPGMVDGHDKAAILARANLFCLPSQSEGFSNAVLEALANATAVMLSPACNFPEVEAAGAGVIVANDVERMATTLRTLLLDPQRLQSMGAAGRRMVLERYTWDAITDRLLDVYERVRAVRA